MPRLSDSMEEATVVRWLKQPGDSVSKGDELVEVETDKATIVYEAERDGVLEEIVTAEGASAELGAVIARLRVEAGEAPTPAPAPTATPIPAPTTAPVPGAMTYPAPAVAPVTSAAPAVEIDFREGIRAALDEELARDERVILFGEDVAIAGGVFAATTGLYDKYGPSRVFDTPISELAMTGAAYGAAVTGLRPVLEIMFGDFLALSMDSLINQATKYWFLTGGVQSAPLVIRSVVGAGGRFGAIHSQMPISWLMGIPGLKIVAPSTPGDAKGLLKAAIRDENPVVFFEHKRLYSLKGEVGEGVVELGRAQVVREGSDVTLVSAMKGVHDCVAAAELLAEQGVDAEVIDLRTLDPLGLDWATVSASLARTHRALVVEQTARGHGIGARIVQELQERCFDQLDHEILRVTGSQAAPVVSRPLNQAALAGPADIVNGLRQVMGQAA